MQKMLMRCCCAIIVGSGSCGMLAASTAWAACPDVGSGYDLDSALGARCLELGNSLAWDLTPSDKAGVAAGVIPERSWENPSLGNSETRNEITEPVPCRGISVAPHYLHQWNKDWLTGVEYEYAARASERPLYGSTRWGHTVTGFVEFGGFRGVDIHLGIGFNATRMPTGMEFGPGVGRSFTEAIIGAGLRFDLPRHWKAKVGTEYHLRDYTTDVQADSAYFEHRDNLWTIGAEVGRRFRSRLRVALRTGYGHRDSQRSDPAVRADEVGYTEYMVSLIAEWPF